MLLYAPRLTTRVFYIMSASSLFTLFHDIESLFRLDTRLVDSIVRVARGKYFVRYAISIGVYIFLP